MIPGAGLALPLVAETQFVAEFNGRISIMPAFGQLGRQDHARDLRPIPHFLGAKVTAGHQPDKQATNQCQRQPDEHEIPLPGLVGLACLPVGWGMLHGGCYVSDPAGMPMEMRFLS